MRYDAEKPFGQPHTRHTLSELHRTVSEVAQTMRHMFDTKGEQAQGYDGQSKGAVVVAPGFLLHDLTTGFMRKALRENGYHVYDSNMGFNFGRPKQMQKLLDQIERIHEKYDGEPITYVGHSLGGVMGLLSAYKAPHCLDHVITMGSPLYTATGMGGVNEQLQSVHNWITGGDRTLEEELKVHMEGGAPPVNISTFYTRSDGFVVPEVAQNPWKDKDGFHNVEMQGSHTGMPANISIIQSVIAHINEIKTRGVIQNDVRGDRPDNGDYDIASVQFG